MANMKTIQQYINLMRRIEGAGVSLLKGFEKLSKQDQELLSDLDAEISNYINEVEAYPRFRSKYTGEKDKP